MKLIKINEDHYIIVDDLEIKEGDFIYGIINGSFEYKKHSSISGYLPKLYSTDKKITHSTQPIEDVSGYGEKSIDVPLYTIKGFDNIQQLSLSEVKELLGEVDVEKRAEKFIGCKYDDIEDNIDQIGYDSFIRGYNQALEDNKEKKYTEEDLKKMWKFGYNEKNLDDSIQSLQPKTEWEVEFIDGKLKLL